MQVIRIEHFHSNRHHRETQTNQWRVHIDTHNCKKQALSGFLTHTKTFNNQSHGENIKIGETWHRKRQDKTDKTADGGHRHWDPRGAPSKPTHRLHPMACLSTCHSTASRKDGSSLTAWCVSKTIYSTEGCPRSTASQFNRLRLYIMSAVWRNKYSTVHFSLKPSTATELRWAQKIVRLHFYLPPPFLWGVEETWDCKVVPLNHLSIELHKTINTNYSRAQRKEGWKEGEVGTNSYYFSFQLRFLAFWNRKQTAGSGGWTVCGV